MATGPAADVDCRFGSVQLSEYGLLNAPVVFVVTVSFVRVAMVADPAEPEPSQKT